MTAVLEAESLYRFFHAGDDETLALQGSRSPSTAGEVVAVTGPSGSGKSTLLACLAGLDEPDGGIGPRRRRAPLAPLRGGARARCARGASACSSSRSTSSGTCRSPRTSTLAQRLAGRTSRRRRDEVLERCGIAASRGPRARRSSPAASSPAPAWRSRWPTTRPSLLADEPTGELDDGHREARPRAPAPPRRRGCRGRRRHPQPRRSPPRPTARSACATGGWRHDRRTARPLRAAPRAPTARGPTATVALAADRLRSVEPGARIALVGPVGLGQVDAAAPDGRASTTRPSGTVTWPAIGDRAVLRPGPVAIVFQGPSLLPPLTVDENVGAAARPRRRSDAEARTAARARARARSTSTTLARQAARGDLRRPGAARRRRPRARRRAAADPRRRADRPARPRSTAPPSSTSCFAAADRPAPRSSSPPTTRRRRAPHRRWEMHERRASPPRPEGDGMVALTWLRGLLAHRRGRLAVDRARRRRRRRAARLDRHVPVRRPRRR